MTGSITIVGLGSGSEEQLTLGIYKILKNSNSLYLRTNIHPVVNFLNKEEINYTTFDYLYDTINSYEEVYRRIASLLIEKATAGESITYAVPGNPMVAEKSVQYLIKECEEKNININILGGESFLDTLFSSLKIDPIDGIIVLNGESFKRSDLNPSKNIIICQVYNQVIASDTKLTLMELYPEEMPVFIVSNLGVSNEEKIKSVFLYELDRNPKDFHHLSTLFIPRSSDNNSINRDFFRLIELVQILRGPNGCPWDKAQTHQSIRKNMIEEAYELVETIDTLDLNHMIEELGDVLLQVMLHSQIAEEDGFFNIYDVLEELNSKLVRRHPHVFGEEKAKQAEEALNHWEKIKQKEKEDRGINVISQLDGIPKDLGEIYKSYKLQKKASHVGFDWVRIDEVFAKIEEELIEVKNADKNQIKEEIGDLLFAVINLSRFVKIDPEEALSITNRKFVKRFSYIEAQLKKNNIKIGEAPLELMEIYWNKAKALDKKGN